MGATEASHRDGDLPLYSCPPLSPSVFPSLASPPKGVLKHSVSQDSESSVEILSKRVRIKKQEVLRCLLVVCNMVYKCIIVCIINHINRLFILFILLAQRRVEENRHVRFSEEVVTIMPPEVDPDWSDPVEDSGEEEDPVQELEHEEERAGFEEVAPARRPALPALILALKNRSSQRKHRK